MGNVGSAVQKAFKGSDSGEPSHPLDPYTKFTDLYDTCPWTQDAARKMITRGILAPIVKSSEAKPNEEAEECPICFMYYSQVSWPSFD